MRESMGSAWIFSICISFIMIFTAYIAISINYARAFRIKNYIVDTIEKSEGYTEALDEGIISYLSGAGYNGSGNCPDYSDEDWEGISRINEATKGTAACIYRKNIVAGACPPKMQYRVTVFFKFDLPVINYISNFRVSGDSSTIYDFANLDGASECRTNRK